MKARLSPRTRAILGGLAALAAVVVIVVVLRSGGADANPLGDASARMVRSCVENVPADQALCQCIADELVTNQSVLTAPALDALRESVEDGRRPPAVLAAASSCRGRV